MDYDYLKFLFTLPPEEIVRWYESKGYAFSWDWRDTWKEAHVKSFTVAKVMKLDILQSIHDEVNKIFSHGTTYREFFNNLENTLRALGWWGKVKAKDVPGYIPSPDIDPDRIVELGSPKRLSTIYQTNANVGWNSGRYKFFIQNAQSRPYWQYKQIDRPKYRKEHALYRDKIFRFDDPIWDKIFPPNGFNCGCYIIALTEAEIKAKGLEVSKGKDFEINVGEGWDYNPGKAAFAPDMSKYIPALQKQYSQSFVADQ